MECTNYMDISHTFSYTPHVKGWGIKEPKTNELDISEYSDIDDMIISTNELPGVPIPVQFKNKKSDHLEFKQVNDELGSKLLAPIRGNCQKEKIGDWIYNFCLGKSVDHEHF